MHLTHDDLTGELSNVSCGDGAIEVEDYPGTGLHIFINTPANAAGESEALELWYIDGRLVVESHTINGTLTPSGERPDGEVSSSSSSVLRLPTRKPSE